MKVWFDVGNPFQANFFHPLMRRLEGDVEILVTTREHDITTSILERKGVDFVTVGRHGGRGLKGKLQAYSERVHGLSEVVDEEKPDLLLTERDPSAVRTAFGFDIPSYTLFYDERERFVNRMVFPLSSRTFAPRFYTMGELAERGVAPGRVVWFDGFHTCYLKGCRSRVGEDPFEALGFERPIVFFRPEMDFASFFGSKEDILYRVVEVLAERIDPGSLVVEPRGEGQRRSFNGLPVEFLCDASCESPVAYADVVVGAAETMLMEAFVLGVPAISCLYWEQSKPVQFLHRYIRHSLDPVEIAEWVEEYLDPRIKRNYRDAAGRIVDGMDNPTALIYDAISEEISK